MTQPIADYAVGITAHEYPIGEVAIPQPHSPTALASARTTPLIGVACKAVDLPESLTRRPKHCPYAFGPIRQLIAGLDKITKTTPYKAGKLGELKGKLEELDSRPLTTEDIAWMRAKLTELEADTDFNYIEYPMGGLRTSRCTKLLVKLRDTFNRPDAVLVIQHIINKRFDGHEALQSLMNVINRRDYASALKFLNGSECESVDAGIKALANGFLKRKIELRICSLEGSKRHAIKSVPFAEIGKQKVYDIDELSAFMAEQPEHVSVSFTFVIDRNCNVLFSEDAVNSFHWNFTGGDHVLGAGELHASRTAEGAVIVHILNNKSGLYLPDTEALEPLKVHLAGFGFNTSHTKIQDEAKRLANDLRQGMRI